MATTSTSLALSGLASGMDWQTVVTQLANAERAPETQWLANQTAINTKNSAFSTIKTDLTTLQTDVQALKDSTLYESRTAKTSDSTLSSASAASGTAPGTYTFKVTQLATAAFINGASNVGQAISPDGNLAAVTLGSAGFATAITAGTFTVNGKQITIATTDSL